MGADVLTMKETTTAKKEAGRKTSYYAEDPKAQYLLMGTDERGKTIYFFQFNVTGLRKRVFGPYPTRTQAIEGFDWALKAVLESFCDVQNNGRGNNGMEHVALPDDLTPVPMVTR